MPDAEVPEPTDGPLSAAGGTAGSTGSTAAAAADGTGEPRVDAAVTRLSGLDAVDVEQAPEVYTAVYDELASVLRDDGPDTGH